MSVFGNRGIISWEGGLADAPCTGSPWSTRPAANRAGLPPPYGVLLVCGDHTHQPNYATALAADQRCRLVGVTDAADVDPRRQRLNEEFARRFEIPLLPDLHAALARDDVQIVSVCAEPYRRGPIIVAAARAGKHLYLDKPLAGSSADAAAIVSAVESSAVCGHMFSLVHSEPVRRIRAVVDSGRLGRLLALHCDLCFAKGLAGSAVLGQRRHETACPTRFELADAKRELTNIGVYSLVLLVATLRTRVRRVSAATGNFFFAEHQIRGMEDFGQMQLELDNDVVCSCTAGRTGWQSHPRGGLNRVYLIGSDDSVMIDADRPRAEICCDGPAWQPPPRNPDDPMGMWLPLPDSRFRPAAKTAWFPSPTDVQAADVAHFLDCLQFGNVPVVDVSVAEHATNVLMAAYESAAAGQSVELPLN